MKKVFSAVLLLISGLAFAQTQPFGYQLDQAAIDHIPMIELVSFDQAQCVREAEEMERQGMMSMYGKNIEQLGSSTTDGKWTTLDNGDKVWQYRFRTAGAQGTAVMFNTLYIPDGAYMFIYRADRTLFVGPYNSEVNSEHGRYRTIEMFGDHAIIEYYQPADVVGTPKLEIRGYVHFYRFIEDPRTESDFNRDSSSEPCEVDVNCPEGDEWENEKHSVVRLSLTSAVGTGVCSGALVNNLNYDCRKLILTAMHCTIDSDDNDLLFSTTRFNYLKSGCGTGLAPTSQQKQGLELLGDSQDGGGNSGSDYAILEMTQNPNDAWDIYYSGWDATGTAPTTGAGGWRVRCLHHPDGDVMKISTSNNVTNGTWGAANHHWRVVWMQTETNWGVTEGGSSGSPIYNTNHHIIGTLTGGGSFCDTPSASDYYGKMDRHWDGNPNPSSMHLKTILDPNNTGIEVLSGAIDNGSDFQPCNPALSVESGLEFKDVSIFPTITADQLNVLSNRYNEITELRIFNSTGVLVDVILMNDLQVSIDVSHYADGMYYISAVHKTGSQLTKKFTVLN